MSEPVRYCIRCERPIAPDEPVQVRGCAIEGRGITALEYLHVSCSTKEADERASRHLP